MRKTFAPGARLGEGFSERLDLFLKVCETGSFSAAARALDLAPSSVTRQIDTLERQVGSRLFTRSTRQLVLSEAGETLREHGSRALVALEEARRAVSGADQVPRGRLRLACTPAFGLRHIVPALPGFLERYPEVNVELLMDDRMVDLVADRIDLALRIGVLQDSNLIAQRIAMQERVTCAAPAYLERRGVPGDPKDLPSHDCLTTPGQPPSGWWVYGEGARARRVAVKGRLVCRNIDALLRAGLDGLGILHMATWLVGEDIRAGRLVQLFPHLPPTRGDTTISLLRPHGPAPAKVRALTQHLQHHFGVPPYWDQPVRSEPRKIPKNQSRS